MMDFQQKAEALAALTALSIKFREREHRIGGSEPWYVSQKVDVKEGSCLLGTYGNGNTPEEAIEDHWKVLVLDLPRDEYLIVNSGLENRRAVRWNGFMWADVPEPERKVPPT